MVSTDFKSNDMSLKVDNVVCGRCSFNQINCLQDICVKKNIFFLSFEAGNCASSSSFK